MYELLPKMDANSEKRYAPVLSAHVHKPNYASLLPYLNMKESSDRDASALSA